MKWKPYTGGNMLLRSYYIIQTPIFPRCMRNDKSFPSRVVNALCANKYLPKKASERCKKRETRRRFLFAFSCFFFLYCCWRCFSCCSCCCWCWCWCCCGGLRCNFKSISTERGTYIGFDLKQNKKINASLCTAFFFFTTRTPPIVLLPACY